MLQSTGSQAALFIQRSMFVSICWRYANCLFITDRGQAPYEP